MQPLIILNPVKKLRHIKIIAIFANRKENRDGRLETMVRAEDT